MRILGHARTRQIGFAVAIAALLIGDVILPSLHESIDAEIHPREQVEVATKLITIPGLGHAWGQDHNDEFWRFLSDKRLEMTP